jgi:hypothetical protein
MTLPSSHRRQLQLPDVQLIEAFLLAVLLAVEVYRNEQCERRAGVMRAEFIWYECVKPTDTAAETTRQSSD